PAHIVVSSRLFFFASLELREEGRQAAVRRVALAQKQHQRRLSIMMASLRGGTTARGKRSGDGRERRLRHERAASIPLGRPKGEGMQASAWRTMSFEKLQNTSKCVNNCSSSTSPETDPGASSVFPSFAEEDNAAEEEELGAGGGSSKDVVEGREGWDRTG
ncbi:unnamed protein product, partial [Ectocarpus sp. 12 AP-2014]